MLPLLASFAAACALLAISPGPSAAVILRQTIRAGRRSAIATVLGNETGVLFWGVGAALGLSALVAASPVAYEVMRYVGATVLIGLGLQSLRAAWRSRRSGRAHEPEDTAATASWWSSYRIGLAAIIANPKAAVFAVSFLPQFVPADAPALPMLLLLAVIWTVVDLVWFLAVVWLVARIREWMARAAVRRWMEAVSGTVLIGLGVRVVTTAA
ncbi:LysE family translocator [Spiractinospora alimapuensis]|uniref:LysE family translocator n=1 Tax=Spiractinospora alimapuensis TaxID=2820884 RepID=UPI001F2166B2|nr:LysE family translocator [Spiractinospora alimapuensis]QVQ52701.1 LysE family translocator [Spiractinospora alimapuensis]